MKELSQRTLQIIERLFSPEQKDEVKGILMRDCSDSLIPSQGEEWDKLRERVQFGVLKVSEGDLARLLSAIILAQTDWRDLLMAAGFGHSVVEHQNWADDILK